MSIKYTSVSVLLAKSSMQAQAHPESAFCGFSMSRSRLPSLPMIILPKLRHKRNKLIVQRHALRKSIFDIFKVYAIIFLHFFYRSGGSVNAYNKKNCYNKQRSCSLHKNRSLPVK